MTTADVTKIACSFVKEMVEYLTRQRFVTNLCLDSVRENFSNYKLITTLEDCLTYEDICEIIGSVNYELPEVVVEEVDCESQLTLNITTSVSSCDYFEQVISHVGEFDAFPVIVLANDSVYQKGYVNVRLRTDCGGPTGDVEIIESGCWSNTPTGPITCDPDYDYSFVIDHRISDILINQNGYIKTIRFYETDSNGLLINTPLDLDVSPTNVASWVGCLLCSGVDPNDLVFGSANWESTFNQLLQNISFTRYGALKHELSVRKSGSDVVFMFKVKHKPASEWMGLYINDFKVDWVNNDETTITVTNPSSAYGTNGPVGFTQDYSFTTPCGETVSGRYKFSGFFSNGLPSSRFNELKINNFKFADVGWLENVVQATCNTTTLIGSYVNTGTGTVINYGWYNSDNELISNDLSITVTESDTYRFFVELDNTCQIQKSITI